MSGGVSALEHVLVLSDDIARAVFFGGAVAGADEPAPRRTRRAPAARARAAGKK